MSNVVELPKFYEGLTIPYIEKRKNELVLLHNSFMAGNFDLIKTAAHRIAGSGGSYGLFEVSRIGLEMEEAAGSGKAMKVKELLEELSHYVNELEIKFID